MKFALGCRIALLLNIGLLAWPLLAICRYTNENGAALTPSDQTVRDSVTGLVWQRTQAASTMSQTSAASYCASLNLNGFSFRLPTVRELSSLVDFNTSSPSIDSTAFPGTSSNYFWTSTTYQPIPTYAWVVDFYGGFVDFNAMGGDNSVRCAR
ncbi:MAG: DUF1566 domain-containing protein [Myxococcaceae bacterium]|nr:DUF1566 domain-containing protein [Myxococcaceae bacterium]MBH2005895.1 DUF1566 domain-containing protein [Myxococcaceae bacterium]